MPSAINVPQGYAARVVRSSLTVDIIGLYAGSLGIWNVLVFASPDRMSILFADQWVLGMVKSGYNLVMEEFDWVGSHANRKNVLYRHPEGAGMTDLLLGDLKAEFEVVDVDHDVSAIYAGLTESSFQVQALAGQRLGCDLLVHPLSQILTAVHKIDSEVLQVCTMKEHVIFSGLWWSPFGAERLRPALGHVEEEELALWKALKAEWGSEALLEHLMVIVAKCVAKRGAPAVPPGPTGVRYLARSALDSVGHYLKMFDANAIFGANMQEAISRWEEMAEEEDQEALAKLKQATRDYSTAYDVCAEVLFGEKQTLPNGDSHEGATDPQLHAENPQEADAATNGATSAAPKSADAEQNGTAENGEAEQGKTEQTGTQKLMGLLGGGDLEDDDPTPFIAHMRGEMQQLSAKQQVLQMHVQYLEMLHDKKASIVQVYSRAMKHFQAGDYRIAKEGFWNCVKIATSYLTAADPELSSAYYNVGRALHLAGLHGPAKEMLKVCIQLRTEQHRHGFVEHALLNKTKKALEQCIADSQIESAAKS